MSATAAPALRPAAVTDADRVLGWRNRPEIVALGTAARGVEAEEHRRWFAQSLDLESRHLLIIEVGGEPAGLARLDVDEVSGSAAVSIYLVPPFLGRGTGPRVLHLLALRSAEIPGVTELRALIRTDNTRSRRAFEHAGYRRATPGDDVPQGHELYVLRTGGVR